jgi:hypothetical protein
MYKSLFFLSALLINIIHVSAQNSGWDFIKSGDHIKAREFFEAAFKDDSTNAEANKGLMLLSELEQDILGYKKYAKSFIRNQNDEDLYLTFKYGGYIEPKEILNKPYSSEGLISAKWSHAYDLKGERKFSEAQQIFDNIFSQVDWSYIGPFENINGSGHLESYGPELDGFNPDSAYETGFGPKVSWIKPKYRDKTGIIYFDDHLPQMDIGSVFYANGFISLQKEKTIQLRLTRLMPIKIWLDDELLFESNERIRDIWDNEIITVTLPQGTHRILVKSSDYSYDSPSRYLSLMDPSSNSYSNGKIALRFTDNKGVKDAGISSATSTNYKKGDFELVNIATQITLEKVKKRFLDSNDDPFLAYALLKCFRRAELFQDCEEFFVRRFENCPPTPLNKYFTAKAYAMNGKDDKAHETLRGINPDQAPIFSLLQKEFNDLDMENDEELWLSKLQQLESITASNYDVILSRIKYYQENGEDEKNEKFIKEKMKEYPDYESRLEYQLDRISKKPKKQTTEKEENKEIKEIQKRIKKEYRQYDYTQLISHYKDRDNFNKVISLYDELLKYSPYSTSYRVQKADYLFENDKIEEAKKPLYEIMEIYPDHSEALTLLGDIYYEQKNREKALSYYLRAKKFSSSWGGSSLDTKIEQIIGQKKLKGLFTSPSFDEIMERRIEWEELYKKEDAAILLFTKDLALDSAQHLEVYHSIMVYIFTETGADDWTEYDFSFMGQLYSANVIKANGAKIRPQVSGGYVVCTNLEPGDRIEIEAVASRNKYQHELGSALISHNYISFHEPIFLSKVEMAIDSTRKLITQNHKIDVPISHETRSGYNFYKWEYSQVPAVVEEDALIDGIDSYAYNMITSLPDWSPIVKWYQQKTYRLLEPTYETQDIIAEVIKPDMTDHEKVVALYDYITKEIKYSYVSFLQSNFTPKKPGKTCSAGIGDCKDVATLMITMLRELKIKSWYVLVKTSNYSKSDILPSLNFDHVIVGYELDGELKYLDLTTNYYPHYVLTNMDVGATALIIREGETEVFKLPLDHLDPKKNRISSTTKAKLKDDRGIDLDCKLSFPGIAGANRREYLTRLNDEEKRNYVLDEFGSGIFDHLTVQNFDIVGLNEINTPLGWNISGTANTYSDKVLDFFVFKIPFPISVQYHPAIGAEKRYNSLDLEQITEVAPLDLSVEIELPKGYKVVKLPSEIKIDNQFGYYQLTFEKTSKGIKATKMQGFKKPIVSPEDFAEFRAFYLKMLDADGTLIPVKK